MKANDYLLVVAASSSNWSKKYTKVNMSPNTGLTFISPNDYLFELFIPESTSVQQSRSATAQV